VSDWLEPSTKFPNGLQPSVKEILASKIALPNPETWWPIEQDYYKDDFAFIIDYPRSYQINLKTAELSRNFTKFYAIKGFSNYGIDGGAATVLDLPLNPDKELKN
jgi:hypothetical protein